MPKRTPEKQPNKGTLSEGYIFALVCSLLSAVVILAYWSVTQNKFVYDDRAYIINNIHIQLGPILNTLKWAFTTGLGCNWHPVTWISHTIDARLYGLNPSGHHLTNLLIHVINTILLLVLLRKLTGSLWKSAFVAALFGVHPLHVESVAWVSERKDVLSTFFWFCTTLAYISYAKRQSGTIQPKSAGPRPFYVLTLILFALGLMSKPMLVTLPLTLLFLDYWPLQRLNDKNTNWKRLIIEKIPFFILTVISSVVTFIVQRDGGAVAGIYEVPLQIRLSNAVCSYIVYIIQMFWPFKLAVLYPYNAFSLKAAVVACAGLFLLVVSFFAFYAAKRKIKYIIFGWLWYVVTLIPVIGLVQVGGQAHADRYTYIPLIGIFIIIAWGVPDILARIRIPAKVSIGTMAIASLVLISLLVIRTQDQVKYWRTQLSLFGHAVAVTRDNWIAHQSMSEIYIYRGDYKKAYEHSKIAADIRPDLNATHSALGITLICLKKYEEAVEEYRIAIDLKPNVYTDYTSISTALIYLGDYDEALHWLNLAEQIEPDNYLAYYLKGKMYVRMGKPEFALSYLNKANKLNKDSDVNVLLDTAQAYAKMDDFSSAIKITEQALSFIEDTGDKAKAKEEKKRLDAYNSGKVPPDDD